MTTACGSPFHRLAAWFLTCLVALGALLVATAAEAQRRGRGGAGRDAATESRDEDAREARARRLFELGRHAFDDGLYEEALRSFRESYELSGRAELLWNIGLSADRLRRDDEAIEAFDRYLRERPDAPNRRDAELRLEALRRARAERESAAQTEGAGRSESAPVTRGASGDESAVPREDAGGLTASPWFWVVVGGVALLVGASVAIGLAASGGEDLPRGDLGPGGVVQVLRW
jgi:tetratricopeptide (TPR) repeat protein